MDGRMVTQIVDRILAERGISRNELCEAIGISSASYTGLKKGSQPREEKILAIEKYLNISSEMLHLTADDIDTERGLIHVRGASVISTGNKLVDKDTTKTTSSYRTVKIVIPRLNDVIENKNGKLITTNPTTLYGSINKLCAKNGLPEVGVHGLRHSFASLAYHLGWSEMTTMREGGWSNPDTVHRIYTHLAAQDANADIKKMQDFYGGVSNLGSKKL